MSLIDDARKLEVFIYEEGMDYPAPTLEQLQALHDLWVAKDRAQGQEPVAQIIRNEAGQITMQSPDGKSFDMSKFIGIQLYTHAQPIAVHKNDICWLIERNSMWGAEWFAGERGWTKEAINAIKFPDKETAIYAHTKFYWLRENPSFPYVMEGGGDWEYTHTITEHIFVYDNPQPIAEIQAEALEKIYARYSHGISGLNLQREIAKLRKGD